MSNFSESTLREIYQKMGYIISKCCNTCKYFEDVADGVRPSCIINVFVIPVDRNGSCHNYEVNDEKV